MVLPLTVKSLVRDFVPFFFLSFLFFGRGLGTATKKAHPWHILTGNSLCQYKSLANFVIRRNGKLSKWVAPELQMPAPTLS